jgi:Flp pilus assembly protein protease CpaA
MGVGLFVSYFLGGLSGLAFGFTGVLLIFIAFGWMWGVKILGAGDVKLLMAFASLAGASTVSGRNAVAFVADLALLTILVGGFIAVILLGIKGRLGAFGKKLYRFLFTMASRNLATEFPKADPSLKMPFGVSIEPADYRTKAKSQRLKWIHQTASLRTGQLSETPSPNFSRPS